MRIGARHQPASEKRNEQIAMRLAIDSCSHRSRLRRGLRVCWEVSLRIVSIDMPYYGFARHCPTVTAGIEPLQSGLPALWRFPRFPPLPEIGLILNEIQAGIAENAKSWPLFLLPPSAGALLRRSAPVNKIHLVPRSLTASETLRRAPAYVWFLKGVQSTRRFALPVPNSDPELADDGELPPRVVNPRARVSGSRLNCWIKGPCAIC